jgi:hypothetical protein
LGKTTKIRVFLGYFAHSLPFIAIFWHRCVLHSLAPWNKKPFLLTIHRKGVSSRLSYQAVDKAFGSEAVSCRSPAAG